MVVHGRSAKFVSLLTSHQVRRAAARDAMLRYALGHNKSVGTAPLLEQLQRLQVQNVAQQIYEAAMDRQLSLIRAKEEHIYQLREEAEGTSGETKIALVKSIVKEARELEALVEAYEDVAKREQGNG